MKLNILIEQFRKNPGMYAEDDGGSLHDLEMLLYGYEAALQLHQITDDFLGFNGRFAKYVTTHCGWNTENGWAKSIDENVDGSTSRIAYFFTLYDTFSAAHQ